MKNLICRIFLHLVIVIFGVTLTGCANLANYHDPFESTASPTTPPIADDLSGGPSVRVVLAGCTRSSMMNLAEFKSYAYYDQLDPKYFKEELNNVLAKRFRNIEYVYWDAQPSQSKVNCILTLEITVQLGKNTFGRNTVNLRGMLSDPNGGQTEIIGGNGQTTVGWPAFLQHFDEARQAAFGEFDRNLQHSRILAQYLSEPKIQNSTIATDQTTDTTAVENAVLNAIKQSSTQGSVAMQGMFTSGAYPQPDALQSAVLNAIRQSQKTGTAQATDMEAVRAAAINQVKQQFAAQTFQTPGGRALENAVINQINQSFALAASKSPAYSGISTTPEQAQAMLKQPSLSEAGGIYQMDGKYAFNVLDSVYYDQESGKLALIGHHDDRFKSHGVPYLQHLGTLLKCPKPEFSLTWTPDSEQRINALFNWHPSTAEGDRIADQWGKVVDDRGMLTKVGRLLLPAMGVDLPLGNNTTAADIVKSLYLANGDKHAADVMNAISFFMRLNASSTPETAAGVRRLLINTLGITDAVQADIQANNNGTMSDVNAWLDIDTRECQALDEALHFSGSPVKNTFINYYQQHGGDPYYAMKTAMEELGRQLVPKLGEMMDYIFTRPQGFQIPPELVEDQFHIHPEMVPQYLGIPGDSLLARAMFDGDYLCKRLFNRPELDQQIQGYQTSFEFEISHPEFRHTTGNYRCWISVEKMDTPQSPDEKTLAFRQVKMRFNVREQTAESTSANGIDLPNKPGGYEDLLTSLWDSFEQEYPTLHELREAAKVAAAAKWILQHNPSASLPENGRTYWRGPSRVPGLVFMELSPDPVQGINKTHRTVIAEGGVSLTPFPQSGVNNPNFQATSNPFPYDTSVVDLRDIPETATVFIRPGTATVWSASVNSNEATSPWVAGWVSPINGGTQGAEAVILETSPIAPTNSQAAATSATGMQDVRSEDLKDALASKPSAQAVSSDQPAPTGPVTVQLGTPVNKAGLQATVPVNGPIGGKKAGEQVLSAGAIANANGDLGLLYDQGRAPRAGSLDYSTTYAMGKAIDPSTFSTRVRNDKRMIAALKDLDQLQATRSQKEEDLKQLTAQRNATHDPDKFKALDKQVEEANAKYQVTVTAVSDASKKIEKLHRTIDDEVEAPPNKQ